jgi:putative FmdB family regulatory protein
MPIYEYRCKDCRKRVSFFWRTFSDAESSSLQCPHCHSRSLTRLVSRVALLRSEESRLDDLADPSSLAGLDEDDPRSIARWMRKMGNETGEDLGPEFDEAIDRLEAGQSPEEIEQSMPALGTDMDAGGPDLDF